MSIRRFKLSTREVLEWALEGVQWTIGSNAGNPTWSRDDWEYYWRAEKELERRLRILDAQEKQKQADTKESP